MPENPYESPRRTAIVSSRHTWWRLTGFYTLAVIVGLRNTWLILSALVMSFGGLILYGREWLNAAQ
ncbi:MAG TPA: hypothetical protein VFW87_02040 [Pirellulales bacterium]|nr:hypothetical protein [Pirellulales bacterium]